MILETGLLIGLVVVALAIVGLVLIQQGKGADMGASFGSGASQTLFGSQGSGNFLTRSTWVLAFIFFGLCLGLAVIAKQKAVSAGKINFETPAAVEQPVAPTGTAAEIPAAPQQTESDSDIPTVAKDKASVETKAAQASDVPAGDIPAAPQK